MAALAALRNAMVGRYDDALREITSFL